MTWRYGRKVLALWNGYEPNNVWAYFDGGFGWLKFRGDWSWESATNFAVLAAHAKADNRFVDFDEDPVQHVKYMTVW